MLDIMTCTTEFGAFHRHLVLSSPKLPEAVFGLLYFLASHSEEHQRRQLLRNDLIHLVS